MIIDQQQPVDQWTRNKRNICQFIKISHSSPSWYTTFKGLSNITAHPDTYRLCWTCLTLCVWGKNSCFKLEEIERLAPGLPSYRDRCPHGHEGGRWKIWVARTYSKTDQLNWCRQTRFDLRPIPKKLTRRLVFYQKVFSMLYEDHNKLNCAIL